MFVLQELLESLKAEGAEWNSAIAALCGRKQRTVEGLEQLHLILRDKEHALCLECVLAGRLGGAARRMGVRGPRPAERRGAASASATGRAAPSSIDQHSIPNSR